MEKIECKSCSAVVDKSIEFCSSCGDWLGLSLQDMEKKILLKRRKFREQQEFLKSY
jgi:hypothetical protein